MHQTIGDNELKILDGYIHIGMDTPVAHNILINLWFIVNEIMIRTIIIIIIKTSPTDCCWHLVVQQSDRIHLSLNSFPHPYITLCHRHYSSLVGSFDTKHTIQYTLVSSSHQVKTRQQADDGGWRSQATRKPSSVANMSWNKIKYPNIELIHERSLHVRSLVFCGLVG